MASAEKIHTPKLVKEEEGRNKKGQFVKRTTFDNGDIREDFLFDADAGENPKFLDQKTEKKDVRPIPKKKGS